MTKVIALLLSLSTSFAFANSDGETIPATEKADIASVVKMIEGMVLAVEKKEGHAFRDAHRKQHGCVTADFEVLNLKTPFRYGVFDEPGHHEAVIRFSNGSGDPQDDREGDGRGMAIKVKMNSPAPKLLNVPGEEDSQDFVMINHPSFFVRNARDYVGFQEAVVKGNPLLWFLNPFHPGRAFHEFSIARKILAQKMKTPLEARYFSMVPSKLGPQQMKFSARPCQGQSLVVGGESPNQLRDNLRAHLAGKSACFDFQVQLRNTPSKMPIEDATAVWDTSLSPFMTVAKIHINKQIPDAGAACEHRTFNPWHGVNDLRPLGGISRVRKDVYLAISRLRLKLNGVSATK